MADTLRQVEIDSHMARERLDSSLDGAACMAPKLLTALAHRALAGERGQACTTADRPTARGRAA